MEMRILALFERRSEGVAGELDILIGVEVLWCAISVQRFFKSRHSEVCTHGAGQSPGQDPATGPVHDCY